MILPRKIYYVIIVSSFLSLFLSVFYPIASAENLANTSILLLRTAPNTNTTTLICITTPNNDNGAEDNLKITYPNEFNVSSTLSNWTVNTSNLPSDSTPWPGIGTATNVNGKTVTFPSLNLSTDTKYCFRTSNAIALTTAASSGNHKGSLDTYQGSSVIDESSFGLSVNSDQITVNGVVPANPGDFESQMTLTSPSGDNFKQNTTLNYTLTYGSNLSSTSNIIVEAEWSLGTVSGSGSPTVEILDYVVGSASNGYNSTPPVIDTINRKITWTINSFPALTTNQTVTFSLKTNASYTGTETASFDVYGRTIGPGTQTPDSTVTKNYLYDDRITPTPTLGPTSPQNTSTPGTPTPTSSTILEPRIDAQDLKFNSVEIREISTTSVTIFTQLNQKANIEILYGTSPSNMTQKVSLKNNTTSYLINITNLLPNTKYYYKILASNSYETLVSEIFTYTTSASTPEVLISENSFLVISNNLLIYSQRQANDNKIDPLVIIPKNRKFAFNAAFENANQIKSIQAFLRNKNVLSAKVNKLSSDQNIRLVETVDGQYSGQLDSGSNIGLYELYFRISDTKGNIFENKIGDFRIVEPLTVLEKDSLKPIEGARIKLFIYNFTTKIYEELNSVNLPINNPAITLSDGTSDLALPQGRYRAEVSSFLYKNQTIDFVLGAKSGEAYPTIYMEKGQIGPIAIVNYFLTTIKDYFGSGKDLLDTASASNRVFNLVGFLLLSIFTLITFVSLLFRTKHNLLSFRHYISHFLTKKNSSDFPTKGIIMDSNNKKVSKAMVSLINKDIVIAQTSTNANGIFFTSGKSFEKIQISKTGFKEVVYPFNNQFDKKIPSFYLERSDNYAASILHSIINFIQTIFGLLFELLIIILIISEILFIPAFGIIKILPFLSIAIFMLAVYFHHKKAN